MIDKDHYVYHYCLVFLYSCDDVDSQSIVSERKLQQTINYQMILHPIYCLN